MMPVAPVLWGGQGVICMTEQLSDAGRLASRLRLLCAELHDEPEQVRAAHIDSELKRALEGRSHSERQAILEELRPMFPRMIGDTAEATGGATGGALDPESALAALEAEAATMTESERQLVAARLARAGYSLPGGRVGWSPETEERVRRAIRLRDGVALDPDRVAQLAAMLADALMKLDDASWASWQEIAPRARVRQRARLRDTLVRFLEGDEDTPRVTVEGDLEQTRMLTALLVGATARAASAAWEHVRVLSPAEIRMGIRGENHRKLWAAFEELAATYLTSHSLEGHMRSFVENDVQDFILGRTKR